MPDKTEMSSTSGKLSLDTGENLVKWKGSELHADQIPGVKIVEVVMEKAKGVMRGVKSTVDKLVKDFL